MPSTRPPSQARTGTAQSQTRAYVPRPLSPRSRSLRGALVKKLMKFAPEIQNSETENYIRTEVDKLLSKPKGQVTVQALDDLERRVRSQATQECSNIILNPFKSVYQKTMGGADEWGHLNEYQIREVTKDATRRKDAVVNGRRRNKALLDEQMRELAEAKEQEAKQKEMDTKLMANNVDGYLAEQQALRDERRRKINAEREAREREVAEVHKRREEERAARRAEEEANLERVRREIEIEQETTAKKKQQLLDKLVAWKKENEHDRLLKNAARTELKKREREEALATMKAMETQEKQREEEMQRLKERMKGREQLAVKQAAIEKNKGDIDNAKLLKEQAAAMKRAEEDYQKREATRERKRVEMLTALEMQVEEAKQRKRDQEQAERDAAAALLRSVEEANEAERQKQMAKTNRLNQYRVTLEDQIRSRLTAKNMHLHMSPVEKQLNRRFLPQV